ncbi:MAG TPA: hypothetical protein VNJ08_07040 [Bacteriovoracaceae bacterium]|nr:hypothetical protein [Bacteriovoracaceae bacterium]
MQRFRFVILKLLILTLLTALISCSSVRTKSESLSDNIHKGKIKDLESILDRAEEKATPDGKVILTIGRSMITEREIVIGSCWDYINAVYNRALYPERKREHPLKSKTKGPFADVNTIQPGDWLYFINHSFSRRDHSGIFVEWIDIDKKKAVMMSYIGGKKRSPATYKIYNLENVYNIIRPKP